MMVLSNHPWVTESRSFTEMIVATAQRKLAAAKARQSPAPGAEKPREAILDALNKVSEALAPDGYAFAPSGPKLSRKCGDFAFEITIQSDRNNVAGQRAAIWVHATIYSRSLTAWRKRHSSARIRPSAPFPLPLFGIQLGYLCHPAGWVEWDFADKETRISIADDLVSAIRSGAYPLFSVFEGPVEGIARIADRDWPSPEGVLSYLLSTEQFALADQTLVAFLTKRPDIHEKFERFRRQFTEDRLPPYRSAIAEDLATFAVATGYPWSMAGTTPS